MLINWHFAGSSKSPATSRGSPITARCHLRPTARCLSRTTLHTTQLSPTSALSLPPPPPPSSAPSSNSAPPQLASTRSSAKTHPSPPPTKLSPFLPPKAGRPVPATSAATPSTSSPRPSRANEVDAAWRLSRQSCRTLLLLLRLLRLLSRRTRTRLSSLRRFGTSSSTLRALWPPPPSGNAESR